MMALDAIDVLYMHYITDRSTDAVETYDFWKEQYNRRPQALLHHLLTEGIIYEDDRLFVTLRKLRVLELKHILKSANLKVSGNKQNLIDRIIHHEDEVEFKEVPLKNVYSLNEQYADFYHRTRFLNYFHFNGNIDIHEVYDYFLDHREPGNHQSAIRFLEDRALKHIDAPNKYQAIKSYYLLSHYALDEMDDTTLSVHYLNHFIMLVILQAMKRYQMRKADDLLQDYFSLDMHTIDRYKAWLKSEQKTPNRLFMHMVDSTEALPYSREKRQTAARFIVDHIHDDAYSFERMRRYLDEDR